MALKDWLKLSRAEHGFIVFLAVVVAQFVSTKKLDSEFLFPALGPMLITWGAFCWGDYFGLKSDKALNRKNLPLVAGTINPRHALWAGAFLMLSGVALTYFVNASAFALALAYTVGAMAYDPILKKRPLLGNAFIASSMSVSFLYGNLSATPDLHGAVLLYAGVAFLAGLGRELLITLRDVEGDRKIGATTLPMMLGPKKTVILASTLISCAVFLSLIPLLRPVHPAYLLAVIATDTLFLTGAYYAVLSQRPENLKKARQLTLVGMLTGVLAFAALGL